MSVPVSLCMSDLQTIVNCLCKYTVVVLHGGQSGKDRGRQIRPKPPPAKGLLEGFCVS